MSAGELEGFQCAWQRNHYVVLPQFLDTPLLEAVRALLRGAEFHEKIHPASGREATMQDNAAVWMLDFLMNAGEVREQVAAICDCGPVQRFDGRIYQLMPGTDQRHDWHTDNTLGRCLGVSVNLGERVFHGGQLQLRHARSHVTLGEMTNTGAGDCVIFRIGDDIEHRVLPVTGAVPRVAYAGWFIQGQTQLDELKAK